MININRLWSIPATIFFRGSFIVVIQYVWAACGNYKQEAF